MDNSKANKTAADLVDWLQIEHGDSFDFNKIKGAITLTLVNYSHSKEIELIQDMSTIYHLQGHDFDLTCISVISALEIEIYKFEVVFKHGGSFYAYYDTQEELKEARDKLIIAWKQVNSSLERG